MSIFMVQYVGLLRATITFIVLHHTGTPNIYFWTQIDREKRCYCDHGTDTPCHSNFWHNIFLEIQS